MATKTLRNSAAFGKRIEYWVIGRMLKEGINVYVPLVDDHAVDAIINRRDGSTALIQIKARSKEVVLEHCNPQWLKYVATDFRRIANDAS